MPGYIPEKGDFILLTFDPQSGHEQKGRRPALVISNTLFNKHTGLAIVCPITNSFRNVPFHVEVPDGSELTGHIMVEQVKSIDHASRKARFVSHATTSVLDAVLGILDACLDEPI